MSARRQFLRSLAILPAALKPAADAIAATAAHIGSASAPPAYLGGTEVATDTPYVNPVEQLARKEARKMIGFFERRNNRRRIGQLAGIDLDLWAVRSCSPTYRALRQHERAEQDRRETAPWRKVIGWLGVEDEE